MILKKDSKRLWPILRIGFSLLLITFLLKKFDPGVIFENIKKTRGEFLIFALLLNLVGDFLSSLQWKFVLSIHHIRLSLKKLFSFYLIGAFLNNFLPTSIGGDVYKVHRLTRELKFNHAFTPLEVRSEGAAVATGDLLLTGFTSVLMTRIMGLWSLLLIATLALFSPLNLAVTGADIKSLLLILWGFVFISLFLPKFLTRIKFISELHNIIDYYRKEKTRVFLSIFTSFIAQVLGIFFCMAVAGSLNLGLSFLQIAYFSSLTIILSAMPLAINGLGLREGSYVWLFNKVNLGGEIALSYSFLILLLMTARSIVGGIIYAAGRDKF